MSEKLILIWNDTNIRHSTQGGFGRLLGTCCGMATLHLLMNFNEAVKVCNQQDQQHESGCEHHVEQTMAPKWKNISELVEHVEHVFRHI